MLSENRSLIFPISRDQYAQLKKEAFNTLAIVSFFTKLTDFPASSSINGFIKLLNIYNGKLFDDWKDFVSLRFEKLDVEGREALIFTVGVDDEGLNIRRNGNYRRWWKALKAEKPTIVYYVKSEQAEKEENKAELFKVINKQTMQRDKKQELTKSVGNLMNKKEDVENTKKVGSAAETVEEPKKGLNYLLKKKERKNQEAGQPAAETLEVPEEKPIDSLISKRESRKR